MLAVPDFSGAYTSSDTWTTAGGAAQVLPRFAATIGLATTTDPVEGEIGSRLAMRLWGLMIPTRKIPLRVCITTTPTDAGTRVEVEAASNQGWYAVSASSLSARIYDRGFRDLFARLRAAAPPA